MNRLIHNALPRILCALCIAVLLTPSAGLSEQMEWSLPENQQKAVRWDILSGYWKRREFPWSDYENEKYVFTSNEGFIEATKYKSDIGLFAGRWKVVRRMIALKSEYSDGLTFDRVLVVTEERFCGTYGQRNSLDKDFNFFRNIDISPDDQGHVFLRADYSLDITPPSHPLSADNENMWKQFRADAESSNYKIEGPLQKIAENMAPQWFRDLVAKDLIHDNRCVR